MTFIKGFWSYVHKDDESEGGRITRLARDVVDQFQMLTGEEISLFLDKDAIEWGANWREAIDSNLASVAFFIPVMSPRYFMSPECRKELQTFGRRASDLGMKELILPLYYVDVPEINKEATDDELINLVRTFQWEDWRELRFFETTSEGYRRAVSRLASRLVEANKIAAEAEEAIVLVEPQATNTIGDENVDDSPGFIDKLAKSEETLMQWPITLNAITDSIGLIGETMKEGTEDIKNANSQSKGFSARLILIRQVAIKITEPTENIWLLSNEFSSQVHDVDEGYRAIIGQASIEIKDNPNSKANFCTFFEAIRNLNKSAIYAIQGSQKMIDATTSIEKMSRDIRPILRRLRQGLTIMIEAMEVSNDWVALIDETGIVCEDLSLNKQV